MRRFAAFILLTAAPLHAQQANPTARERVLQASAAASEAVYANGVLAGLPNHLSNDAVLVWPGAAVLQGTPAIGRFLAAQASITGANISWQTLHLEMAADSSLAVGWGVAVIDRAASGAISKNHRIARFLTAWKPVEGAWRMSALVFTGLLNGAETVWGDSLGATELPMLHSIGAAGPFIAADSVFAAQAGREGAQKAFTQWATGDAVMFSGSGELAIGKQRINALFEGDDGHWSWGAVAAGASRDGSLGWTAGHAVIVGKGPDGKEVRSKSKYLTLWRRQADGTVRFISDGGNGRP